MMSDKTMTAQLRKKAERCVGCDQNFYNGNNNMGIQVCWSLAGAKLVSRKRVHMDQVLHMDQVPPWTQKPEKVYDCRRERHYVFVEPTATR
jgi:hypothetical protein